MKVSDVMSATPFYCSRDTNLGSAAELLWDQNCGILPIVDENQKVAGVVTDRDLFIALGTRNQLPGEITVGQVSTGVVHLCYSDDDIQTALETMSKANVRRLPVIDRKGVLQGILSIDDIVVQAEPRKRIGLAELSFEDVMDTLKKICAAQSNSEPRRRGAVA